MMICSERTRGSREARPGLLRRVGLMLACLIGGLGVWTQPAAAQYHVNYFWSVVDGSTTLQPGESVTLQLNAMRTPDFPETLSYVGGQFTVLISGWDAADSLITNTDGTFGTEDPRDTESFYLGRNPGIPHIGYRNPFPLEYILQPKSVALQELISDQPGQGIDHFSFRLFDKGDPANPTGFFRVQFVAGTSLGTRIFVTAFTLSQVTNNSNVPTSATFIDGSIGITVVPSSPVVSLLMISAVAFGRQKR